MFLIHQCVDAENFEKVGDCKSSKKVWEILEKAYAWADNTKVVRLQIRKRRLELIQIEEKKIINDFTTRITRLVNQVKSCREIVTEQYAIAKILCSLTPIFDNVIVEIEE